MDLFEGKRETSVLLKAINTLHEGQDGLMNLGKLIGSVVSQPRVCPHPLMQSSIFSQDCLPHVVWSGICMHVPALSIVWIEQF